MERVESYEEALALADEAVRAALAAGIPQSEIRAQHRVPISAKQGAPDILVYGSGSLRLQVSYKGAPLCS